MHTIKVNKQELNKAEHSSLVKKAKSGFKKAIKKKLEDLLRAVEKDNPVSFKELYDLPQPVDKTEDYNRAIEMLEMSVDETIEISEMDFRCFVQEKWAWTEQAHFSNSRYV